MANHNFLEGVKCPRCGQEGRFLITAAINCLVTDDGSDPVGHHYWDDDSCTYCPGCGFHGALKEFRS